MDIVDIEIIESVAGRDFRKKIKMSSDQPIHTFTKGEINWTGKFKNDSIHIKQHNVRDKITTESIVSFGLSFQPYLNDIITKLDDFVKRRTN